MSAIMKEMKVGEVSRRWPATLKVFARYQLDLCCGGVHTLDYVSQKHGLKLEQVLRELNEAVAETPAAVPARCRQIQRFPQPEKGRRDTNAAEREEGDRQEHERC